MEALSATERAERDGEGREGDLDGDGDGDGDVDGGPFGH